MNRLVQRPDLLLKKETNKDVSLLAFLEEHPKDEEAQLPTRTVQLTKQKAN